MSEIICTALTAFSAVLVAIISRIHIESTKKQEENQKKAEAQAAMRRKEALLQMKMIDATMQLSIVSANALTNGHNNGNVERARNAAEKATEEYEEFMMQVVTSEVNK